MSIYTLNNERPIPVVLKGSFLFHFDRGDGRLLCGERMRGDWQYYMPYFDGADFCNVCMERAGQWTRENDPEMWAALKRAEAERSAGGDNTPVSNTGVTL